MVKRYAFVMLAFVACTGICSQNVEKSEDISPTEDLMREHGVLNRILLIYEEIARQLQRGKNSERQALLRALEQTASLTNDFIENYHEKLEEDHLFPLFSGHKEQSLAQTLRQQHDAGRAITSQLRALAKTTGRVDKKMQKSIIDLIRSFIRMYRPHMTREDTVLFPAIRSIVDEKAFERLGEAFEELEHQLFGEEGFFAIVKQVEKIEKDLGIYRLEQFTPHS